MISQLLKEVEVDAAFASDVLFSSISELQFHSHLFIR